eukprot:GHVN01086546.1.p1 GENE.GHVN01086546.1~~GHVN01086546.1.p1  ORF type:complete len:993 (+),score=75.41 GHVN01086546.1:3-2981(+)
MMTRFAHTRTAAMNEDIDFQQIDVEEVPFKEKKIATHYRCYGATADRRSVACLVTGFSPYFLAHVQEKDERLISEIRAHIIGTFKDGVSQIEVIEGKSIYGYTNKSSRFLRIKTHTSAALGPIKKHLMEGFRLKERLVVLGPYESNIPSTLRFMVDTEMTGMCWVTLPRGKYTQIESPQTTCDVEVEIKYSDVFCHESIGRWAEMAPLRILSFDIECISRPGVFPDAEHPHDAVIQIGNEIRIHGHENVQRNLFVLNGCDSIPGVVVHRFESEKEMLLAWRDYVVESKIDIVIGYNINNFDWPYLVGRAAYLKADGFLQLGKKMQSEARLKKTHFQSSAYGTRISNELECPGTLVFDIFQVMQRDYKLRSYSLNSVSSHFLGKQKDDIKHTAITELHGRDGESRRRIGAYCMKDVALTRELMERLMLLYNYTEIARVTGVPFSYILLRGQQIRVLSRLLRISRTNGFYIPEVRGSSSDEQYEGATVLEPKKGYYDRPIATLDFVSLYPSIIIANNLCYTTLIRPGSEHVPAGNVSETPFGDSFVDVQTRRGLLPDVLQGLLDARQKAKEELKQEKDPFKRAVLNGRQNALKICANSVYGFTGSANGFIPCLPISRSVTAYGRQMINKTIEAISARYTPQNGFKACTVIYGDTDSVMVDFHTHSVEKAMLLGVEAAKHVTEKFKRPIELKFEKVYFPYLLISKKRYAGLYWTRPETHDKIDVKGIESVRRDNCSLVPTVMSRALHMLLIDRDVDAAKEYVKQTVSALLRNKIDISALIITKTFTKEDYHGKQAHVELVKKMRARDSGSAPVIGERVPYIIIRAAKNTPLYARAEDPLFVLENNIPIDTAYYLENQLSNPISRLFSPITSPEELFSGEHTRAISVPASKNTFLSKFSVKVLKCMKCKARVEGTKPLCVGCRSAWKAVILKKLHEERAVQTEFTRLWVQCQRCQGSLMQEVICSNSDCPIFYRRHKARMDKDAVASDMSRLTSDW